MKKTLIILGTRPEAIKLAPLVAALLARPNDFAVTVCSTGQHRQMLDEPLSFFNIVPDVELSLMHDNQQICDIAARAITGISGVIATHTPDLVIVQGDTTTAAAGALAGYYNKVAVAHVEAGLRSNDLYAPYPEEGNRAVISRIADYHFAPTRNAAENLYREGIERNVWVVGNTGIDALLLGLSKLPDTPPPECAEIAGRINPKNKLLMVTCHRRESFGLPLVAVCRALATVAKTCADCEIVYPVHCNPRVRATVGEILGGLPRVHLIEPVGYRGCIWLMKKSFLILTDSGGIQEEAPSINKPVLVLREVTERMEGVTAGCAKIVGTNEHRIVTAVQTLLANTPVYEAMASVANPYGDGQAAKRIADILAQQP